MVHQTSTLVGQRIVAIALGYEDVDDHDTLRFDPVLGLLSDRLEPKRDDCARLAGKSTLNRLERSAASDLNPRYHKLTHDAEALESLFVDLFLDAHKRPPKRIVLDVDATDDPLHGEQEGRFFHGYYKCYCYLPLYVFCGHHLLAAKLRPSNIDASAGATDEVARIVGRIRHRWPKVKVLLRGDSAFAREEIMAWCEANGVDCVFGLAKNERLVTNIEGGGGGGASVGGGRACADRQGDAAVQGVLLPDARELEPAPPGGGQGRALGERIQSALHRYLLGRG